MLTRLTRLVVWLETIFLAEALENGGVAPKHSIVIIDLETINHCQLLLV